MKDNNALTKLEIRRVGYWPSFGFAYLWTDSRSRSINTPKKRRGQYSAILTEQARVPNHSW